MNDLSRLLSKRNLELLDAISYEELSLRGAADKLNCSPGKVHQAVALFKKHGIVTVRKVKNRMLISPNRESPVYQKIKALMNISKIVGLRQYKKLAGIARIGVYGSYSQGTDDKDSDIDLLIITEKKELQLRDAIRQLEDVVGKKVNPLVLTRERLEKLESEDKEFHTRLKITVVALNGDIFGQA